METGKKLFIVVIINFILLQLPPLAGQSLFQEYQVKAVFLGKLAQYITWPESQKGHTSSKAFVLCILGKSPFGSFIEKYYGKNQIDNRPVRIRYMQTVTDCMECNLVFIGKTNKKNLEVILKKLKNRPILTICDSGGVTGKKFHFHFFLSKKKVNFLMNKSALIDSGLKVSAVLLDYLEKTKKKT